MSKGRAGFARMTTGERLIAESGADTRDPLQNRRTTSGLFLITFVILFATVVSTAPVF